ncbi:MAG: alpha/beta hydrolase [Streptosporangiaceae bacterium]|nr:alpha/beta hydrolase [Streptosporangiaceae bacterium]MBV9854164.1 alpha/beta hydrolase [Streptosporangiaceae bacterium]
METQRQLVEMPDGRRSDVLTAGPGDGLPLVLHGGTPSGLVVFPPTVEAARTRGLRIVIVARPGYENSSELPGRKVYDVVPDVAAVLDALGADTFLTIGWSGGGPHALACAAGLPGRCLAAASVAGVAPYNADGLDWRAGMGPENITEFGAAVDGAEPLTAFLEKEAGELRTVTGDVIAEALGGLVSPADAAALTGEFAASTAASMRAAVRNGIAGWRDDDLAFVRDWGFTLGWPAASAAPSAAAAVEPAPEPGTPPAAPVAIWQGDQDRMVPFAHGQWLAGHIPGARAYLLPGEGHLTLKVSAFGRILDDLLDLAGLTA